MITLQQTELPLCAAWEVLCWHPPPPPRKRNPFDGSSQPSLNPSQSSSTRSPFTPARRRSPTMEGSFSIMSRHHCKLSFQQLSHRAQSRHLAEEPSFFSHSSVSSTVLFHINLTFCSLNLRRAIYSLSPLLVPLSSLH